jgi:hypothetical protein
VAQGGAAGAGGEGRPERVGDTRGGRGRRGGRTPPWEETGQVWLRRRVPAGRRLAPPPTNTTTQPRSSSSAPSPPSEPQLFLRLPLLAGRRSRARCDRAGRGSGKDPLALTHPHFSGALQLSLSPPTVSAAARLGPSARRHELQRRLPPADQHAGPHDPR